MNSLTLYGAGYLSALKSLIKVFLLIILSYLLQTSVVPYLKIRDVMPNLLMLCIAVLTVSKGKRYAFASGAMFGILLETMSANLPMFNLLIYPALALLAAQAFADMSELKREMLRIRIAQRQAEKGAGDIAVPYRKKRLRFAFRRKSADDMNPHLRILLNTLLLTVLYEFIMIAYIALGGIAITWQHAGRVLRTLLYSGAACVLMFPARAFLGMYGRRRARTDTVLGDALSISEQDLHSIALAPDLPPLSAAAVAVRDIKPLDNPAAIADEPGEPTPKETVHEN